jgi:hypothetical protein
MSERDQNREVVGKGVDENGDIQPLLVDPSTSALKVDVILVSDTTPVNTEAQIDPNRIPNAMGSDDNGNTRPFLIDSRNDRLWVDLVVI